MIFFAIDKKHEPILQIPKTKKKQNFYSSFREHFPHSPKRNLLSRKATAAKARSRAAAADVVSLSCLSTRRAAQHRRTTLLDRGPASSAHPRSLPLALSTHPVSAPKATSQAAPRAESASRERVNDFFFLCFFSANLRSGSSSSASPRPSALAEDLLHGCYSVRRPFPGAIASFLRTLHDSKMEHCTNFFE